MSYSISKNISCGSVFSKLKSHYTAGRARLQFLKNTVTRNILRYYTITHLWAGCVYTKRIMLSLKYHKMTNHCNDIKEVKNSQK